jgi:hypothetical protein
MPKFVLAVDPGKVTGMALASFGKGSDPQLIWADELEMYDYYQKLHQLFATYGDDLEIICEKFTINVQTAKKSQAPYSLECIGILKAVMMYYGRDPEELKYQLPANAMSMFPNAKIKTMGYWYRGGAGHALDAIRHALLYVVQQEKWNFLPLLRKGNDE